VCTPQVLAQVRSVLLARPPGRYAFEAVDQFRQRDGWWVVHERVDVVVLAVELAQLRAEVGAYVGHDLLAAGADRVGGRAPAGMWW